MPSPAPGRKPPQPVARPALRYHGGKFRLAPWLLQFFPPHGCYVEPFGGAAGVLLQKPRAYAEVYNDLDGGIVNFFRVLRDASLRAELIKLCRLTPYARAEFLMAYEHSSDPVERARRTCVRAAMGFGSAGATKGSTGFRIDTRRKYGTAQHNWSDYPDSIAAIGERMSGVMIENRDAVDVIGAHDGVDTLFLIDPPYLPETRVMRTRGAYRHEMDPAEHLRLLTALKSVEGMVVLCGYRSDLYDTELSSWQRFETKSRISAGRGAGIRTEVAWLNPA
ncbi:DNA adenine methylase [Nevskia sp.]|uniref:DNA adenine methylase n=1 Tax=Nevskia sp. TaxID=1929292 RepID=UPI003F729E0E